MVTYFLVTTRYGRMSPFFLPPLQQKWRGCGIHMVQFISLNVTERDRITKPFHPEKLSSQNVYWKLELKQDLTGACSLYASTSCPVLSWASPTMHIF